MKLRLALFLMIFVLLFIVIARWHGHPWYYGLGVMVIAIGGGFIGRAFARWVFR